MFKKLKSQVQEAVNQLSPIQAVPSSSANSEVFTYGPTTLYFHHLKTLF